MQKKLILVALIPLFIFIYLSCTKKDSVRVETESPQITAAKQYFNEEVLPAANSLVTNSAIYIPTLLKKPLWDRAYTLTLNIGEVVVVPISYENKLYVKTDFGAGDMYQSLDDVAKLVIFKTRDNNYHSEVVTGFRDSLGFKSSGQAFSGFIQVEDWVGNPLKSYFNDVNKGLLSLKPYIKAKKELSDNIRDRTQAQGSTNFEIHIDNESCYTFLYEGDHGNLVGVAPGESNNYTYTEVRCFTTSVTIQIPETYGDPITGSNYISVISSNGGGGGTGNDGGISTSNSGVEVFPNISDYESFNDTNYPFSPSEVDNTPYPTYNPQDPWPTISPVISLNDFVGYHDKKNCLDLAVEQLGKKNYQISAYYKSGQTFVTYTESGGVNATNTANGVSYLLSALQRGIPVIVGVSYRVGAPAGNPDNSTDHFVVIVGSGSDAGGKYFRFYDSWSSWSSKGANSNNKLYYYPGTTNDITGYTSCTREDLTPVPKYKVTQIRKSKTF